MDFNITATTTIGIATSYGTNSPKIVKQIVALYRDRGYTNIKVNGVAVPADLLAAA